MLSRFLDQITMYRLTIYYLIGLLLIAILASVFGVPIYPPQDILITAIEFIVCCLAVNKIFAEILGVKSNYESSLITALILALVITPRSPLDFTPIVVSSVFGIGSKYLLTVHKHHIFNPTAAGMIALSLLTSSSPSWWVGIPSMTPFVLMGGYLVVKKADRMKMAGEFLITFLLISVIAPLVQTGSIVVALSTTWMSLSRTALLFFTTLMFIEPATSPGTNKKRSYFAYFTAMLYATPQLAMGVVFSPEVALAIANIFSSIIDPQRLYVFKLKLKRLIAKNTYEFEFDKPKGLKYIPGQYMQWSLPHPNMDDRGSRRYFSLSSTQDDLPAIVMKYYEPPSSFKKKIVSINAGDSLTATNLSGDFVLPQNMDSHFVFIAAGVGIAPFRGIIKDIVKKRKHMTIDLLYINRTDDEICFPQLWKSAQAVGIRTHLVLTDKDHLPAKWNGLVGHLNPEMLMSIATDWKKSTYYLSGPAGMVRSCKEVLRKMKIPQKQIVTDFFPGY